MYTTSDTLISASADIKASDLLDKHSISWCSFITFFFFCEVIVLVIILCIVASILVENW